MALRVIRKSSFLLLEVLIAFVLIVMCVVPLLYPHTFLLLQQKKFIHAVEADHLANLLYADIVERLYRNEIPWSALVPGQRFEVDDFTLQRLQFDKKLPYAASYSFNETKHKPKNGSPTHFLLKLEITLVPQEKRQEIDLNKDPSVLHYFYNIFVIRNLGEPAVPDSGDTEGEQAS